ncbi:MAG: 23S rRNA (uracil(1939)-C(5))-methyltransferase RlmD [Gammaproteobacteria bacterium]
MARRRRRRRLQAEPIELEITAVAHDGRGIAHVEGKTVFVHGALQGERVRAKYVARYRQYDVTDTVEVLRASPVRSVPRCEHFGYCGGCALQHMQPDAQVAMKQSLMLEQLERLSRVAPAEILAPLRASEWGYRRKARLGVRDVPKKGRVLVGFRERHSNYIADLKRCDVLVPEIGGRLPALSELIGSLSLRSQIPQIEVAVGDNAAALVFRTLEQPAQEDLECLGEFGKAHQIQILLQPGGPEHLIPLWPARPDLWYELPEEGVRIRFRPTDFTQVNAAINRQMVARAVDLLAPEKGDSILDLFCGLGNFTLPLAKRCDRVVGVEGDPGLIERARANAAANGIGNARFLAADLSGDQSHSAWAGERFDKVLLDPPRSGAREVLPLIAARAPSRIVYVSCNPATLARDAGDLVNRYGYRLQGAGVMDMFPHTGHVESIAVFERS